MRHEELEDFKFDHGVFENRDDFQQSQLFWLVIRSYDRIRNLSPIVAYNPDPFAPRTRLGFHLIDFLVDVELATKKALRTPALYRFWQRLVDGEDIPAATKRTIIERCSRLYRSRGLMPVAYFKRIKKGRSRKSSGS